MEWLERGIREAFPDEKIWFRNDEMMFLVGKSLWLEDALQENCGR